MGGSFAYKFALRPEQKLREDLDPIANSSGSQTSKSSDQEHHNDHYQGRTPRALLTVPEAAQLCCRSVRQMWRKIKEQQPWQLFKEVLIKLLYNDGPVLSDADVVAKH